MKLEDRINDQIATSPYVSRDLSWVMFNYRVLDQAIDDKRNLFERLKFLAITSSNLDEFFMIRVGSLYNYLDYGKERIDYSGLRENPFRKKLLTNVKEFVLKQNRVFIDLLSPMFDENGLKIETYDGLSDPEKEIVNTYFHETIYPMLTPMVYDNYHTFPLLMNQRLIFGVVTQNPKNKKDVNKLSFIQIPKNLPRFFEIYRDDQVIFVPIENIIRGNIEILFRNVDILSVTLFRVTRNGDFTLEESDDIEANFLEELQLKLKTRKTGRVVRIQIEEGYDTWMINLLKRRWELDDDNIFTIKRGNLIDFTSFFQIVSHPELKDRLPRAHPPVPPMNYPEQGKDKIFDILEERDVLLHHPYNSMEPVLELIEKAAEDPHVLAIKITIYRLARDSRVSNALLKAAENGKHVSVLFEVKARFDEENNLKEALKLQKAGCFVIYGISSLKTHTKLLMIVRQIDGKVTTYVHMSTGNYNETTSRLYTDLGLMTTNKIYARDLSEFFNVITGHSQPDTYQYLITSPDDMRKKLIKMIRNEAENARNGKPAGIVIKINSLEDKATIEEFYAASQAGVRIKLIVRGICCLRPGRVGLSENIEVYSVVGDFLEHSRIFYFHNEGKPKVYAGSADIMVRSFERRLESLFLIEADILKKQAINILYYNLKDNVNRYQMNEDGTYTRKVSADGEPIFNIHEEFFKITRKKVTKAVLF